MLPRSDCDTIFIDDSGFGSTHYIFTGIYIPKGSANLAIDRMDLWRTSLDNRYGISMRYELHAYKFVNNRGRPAGQDRPLFQPTRTKVFNECLEMVAGIPDVRIFNTLSTRAAAMEAFSRLLNRLQIAASVRNSKVKIFSDLGKETEMNQIMRVRQQSNLTPSKYGQWGTGGYFKNVSLDRVDPEITYLDSKTSHFIQAADFCAYSMLRWKVESLPNRTRQELHESYKLIEPVFEVRAYRADPHGIIRA